MEEENLPPPPKPKVPKQLPTHLVPLPKKAPLPKPVGSKEKVKGGKGGLFRWGNHKRVATHKPDSAKRTEEGGSEEFAYKRNDSQDHTAGFTKSNSFRVRSLRFAPRPPSQKKLKAGSKAEDLNKAEQEYIHHENYTTDEHRHRMSVRETVQNIVRHLPRPPSLDYREHVAVKKARGEWYGEEHGKETKHDLSHLTGLRKVKYRIWLIGHQQWVKIHQKYMPQRALLCILAVSLLWVTSLAVCNAIVSTSLQTTTYENVKLEITSVIEIANDEGKNYEGCVESRAKVCNQTYLNQKFEEEDRVKVIEDLNQQIIDYLLAIRDSCAMNNTDGTQLIRYLFADGSPPLNIDEQQYKISNAQQCSNISVLIDKDVLATRSYDIAASTGAAGAKAFEGVKGQLLNRIAYDLNYLGEKTGADEFVELENLLADPVELFNNITNLAQGAYACIDPEETEAFGGVPPQCSPPWLQQVAEDFNKYKNTYDTMVAEAEAFKQYATDAYNSAKAIYDTLNACGVCKAAFETFGINSWLALGSLVLPPCTYCTQLVDDINQGVQNKVEDLEKQADDLINQTRYDLIKSQQELEALNEQYRKAQQEYIDSIIGDYNPPEVDNNFTDEEYLRSTTTISDRIADALNYIPTERPDPDDVDEFVQQTEDSAANLLERLDPREFDLFSYGEDIFNEIDSGLARISSLLVTFDTVYRILQSLVLIRKYWTISNIQTPPADVRYIGGGEYRQRRNPLQLLARLLTHPATYLILFTAGVALGSLSLYTAYEPFYSAYVDGCVNAVYTQIPSEKEGTMLFRNGFTMAISYSYSSGDQIITEKIDALNVERSLRCRDAFDDSLVSLNTQKFLYDIAMSDQKETAERFNVLSSCVNFQELDSDYGSQLNNTSLEEIFLDETCNNEFNLTAVEKQFGAMLDLSDGFLFNCSNIDQCQVTQICTGPNENRIKLRSHVAACTTEWYAHGLFLSFVFSASVFTILNVTRFYFMRGIVSVWWRQLSNNFSYWASCTEDGQRINPKEVTEDGEEFEVVVQKKLKKTLWNFQKWGYVYVVIAILLNLPWIVALGVLSRTFAFTQ